MININSVTITPQIVDTQEQFVISVSATATVTWADLVNTTWAQIKQFTWAKLKGGN